MDKELNAQLSNLFQMIQVTTIRACMDIVGGILHLGTGAIIETFLGEIRHKDGNQACLFCDVLNSVIVC